MQSGRPLSGPYGRKHEARQKFSGRKGRPLHRAFPGQFLGAPEHIGDPAVIGIKDVNKPDFGVLLRSEMAKSLSSGVRR